VQTGGIDQGYSSYVYVSADGSWGRWRTYYCVCVTVELASYVYCTQYSNKSKKTSTAPLKWEYKDDLSYIPLLFEERVS
jgi:hypothetical protein